MTLRRDPMSDLFVMTCDACGQKTHIDSDMGVGAAAAATRAGWSVSMVADYCRDCVADVPEKPRSRRKP